MSLPFDSVAATRSAPYPALVPITVFAGPLTRADLEAIPEDGRRYELIDGCLIVTPSPGPPHQLMLGELYLALRAAQTPAWYTILGLDYMPSEWTTFVPDLLVVDHDERRRGGKGTRPELVVEVLSPSTRHIDRGLKRAAYAAAGVPLYWILDPRQPSLLVLELAGDEYLEAARVEGDEVYDATRPFPVTLVPAALGIDSVDWD